MQIAASQRNRPSVDAIRFYERNSLLRRQRRGGFVSMAKTTWRT